MSAVSRSTISAPRASPTIQPVGTHPQRLPHQVAQAHLTCALDVGGAALEPDDVLVVCPQLACILGNDQPLRSRDEVEQGPQQRRLAGARPAGHHDGQAGCYQAAQQCPEQRVEAATAYQVVERQRPVSQDANGQQRSRRRDGREHGVQPAAVREADVNEGSGVVEPAPGSGGEPHGQPADVVLVTEGQLDPAEQSVTLDPHLVGPVDQHVGDTGVGQQGLERPRANQLAPRRLDGRQRGCTATRQAGAVHGCRERSRAGTAAAGGSSTCASQQLLPHTGSMRTAARRRKDSAGHATARR